MRELFVGTRTVPGEDGQTHRFACESYGVKVREAGGETAAIPDLTVDTRRIDALLELLTRNTVGPAGLRDVVDDWL